MGTRTGCGRKPTKAATAIARKSPMAARERIRICPNYRRPSKRSKRQLSGKFQETENLCRTSGFASGSRRAAFRSETSLLDFRLVSPFDGTGTGHCGWSVAIRSELSRCVTKPTKRAERVGSRSLARVKKGDKIVLWYISANRPESLFPDSHLFKVDRGAHPFLAIINSLPVALA
jgi:hypothetical protein